MDTVAKHPRQVSTATMNTVAGGMTGMIDGTMEHMAKNGPTGDVVETGGQMGGQMDGVMDGRIMNGKKKDGTGAKMSQEAGQNGAGNDT